MHRTSRPLFIPLRAEYFAQFAQGEKEVEYRAYGPRWNERTCELGRPVVLSLGYSGARLNARVIGFERRRMSTEIYGPRRQIAVIRLSVERSAQRSMGSR